MPDKRDLSLNQYEISKHRYRELYNFCLQYPEWLEQKRDCYSLSTRPLTGMPNGSGVSDPTAAKAEKAYRLGKNIELVEQTAIEACGTLYPYILTAATEGMNWELLQPPCGRRQFYEARRRFFFLLSLKKY